MSTEVIYTNQAIEDPVAYIQADDKLARRVGYDGHGILSGPDLDVLISPYTREPMSVGRTDTQLSKLLGKLFMSGEADGVRFGEAHANLEWYQSPQYCNQLSERLDLKPGEDVLKVVHGPQSDKGKIDANIYYLYTAEGEYPQSLSPNYFAHDRKTDHILGVLCMPPHITRNVIHRAGQVAELPNPGKKLFFKTRDWDTPAERMSHEVDRLTAVITRIALAAGNDLDLNNLDFVSRYVFGQSQGLNRHAWGADRNTWNNFERRKRYLAEHIGEHLEILMPKIQLLKDALAK